MYVESITLLTKEYNEYTVITPKVLDIVKRSGVQNGTVTVLTKHTTTGVTGHLKAMLTGNHCHFPVIDGEMVRGGAQEIYFCEFDGPAHRTINVIIQEEK